jgi:hypothetical protein
MWLAELRLIEMSGGEAASAGIPCAQCWEGRELPVKWIWDIVVT